MENKDYELKQQMEPMNDTLRAKLKTLGFEDVAFEPKVKNRFIATMEHVPSHLIKSIHLPDKRVYKEENKPAMHNWGTMEITLYNPVSGNLEKTLVETDIEKEHEITVKILDPVGEVITTWVIHGTLSRIAFDSLDWSNKGVAALAYLSFDVNSVVIE